MNLNQLWIKIIFLRLHRLADDLYHFQPCYEDNPKGVWEEWAYRSATNMNCWDFYGSEKLCNLWFNSHLTSIRSDKEYKALNDYISSNDNVKNFGRSNYYIGGEKWVFFVFIWKCHIYCQQKFDGISNLACLWLAEPQE